MGYSATTSFSILLTLLLNPLALAGSKAPTPQPDEITTEGEIAQLRQAYVYLEAGNHDYHGHRVKALKAVGAACHALGFKAKRDGDNHEQQKASDNFLDSARNLLIGALPHAENMQQKGVVGHLKGAIHEIDLALAGEPGAVKPPPSSPGSKK